MALSTLMQTVYASAPDDAILISTLEIQVAGQPAIRLVHAYDEMTLGVPGLGMQIFEACSLEIALPKKDTSGNQTLTFGLGLVDSRAQNLVVAAQESGEEVLLIYREYLGSDLSAPSRAQTVMVVAGGEFNGPALQIEASYFDLLNTAWPRQRYTAQNAPGVKFMS